MSIVNLYNQVLMSEAAYSDLEDITSASTIQELVNALVANKFSKLQAENFAKHWRVAHHQPDTSSGFSATLFESIDNPGEYTFAIRGTKPTLYN